MSCLMFLSCSLSPQDEREVNAYFKNITEFYDVQTFTVNIPGVPDDEVIRILKETIPKVDGIIVLWVPRYNINGSLPSLWTVLESVLGLAKDKPVYVFYERGIALEGPLKSIGKAQIEFNRWYFSNSEEHERLCSWVRWIKEDIERKKVEDFWKGVATVGSILLAGLGIFGLGVLCGRASKQDSDKK